jgi:hypothetical protein
LINSITLFFNWYQRHSSVVTWFTFAIFFSADLGFAQSTSDQRRETYYQNLEARARSLSQKLAEISGTEPIPFHSPKRSVLSTMESNPTNASPQTAYDSLPGPIVEPASTSAPQSETLYRADGTPVILQAAPTTSPAIASPPSSVLKKRAIRRNMEKERGAYFIQPFVGVAVPPSTQTFKGLSGDASVETEIGNAVGLSFGRRWDNLEGEVHLGYLNSAYGDISNPMSPFPYTADGQLEVFQIGARVGYGIPFGEKGWFRVAGGFGFANRRDVLNVELVPSGPVTSYLSSETAFTYDLLLSLGYEVGMGLDAFLAYRLLGVSENGDFDSVAMHLFQVGLGANF